MNNSPRHWPLFAKALHAAALVLVGFPDVSFAQTRAPEILVASATQDAEGLTEASMSLEFLKALERLAADGITRKATAALLAEGVRTTFPPLQSLSTYTTVGGKKLAIVKLRNTYANQVVVHGFVGQEFRRVICARSRDYDRDLPVFYGPCGEEVRTTFNLKGFPDNPTVK